MLFIWSLPTATKQPTRSAGCATLRTRLTELGFSTLWRRLPRRALGRRRERSLKHFPERFGDVLVIRASGPSEPLRKVLAAEAAARASDDDTPGWGPGLYVESEVIEALGRKLKNAPTRSAAADTSFYRVA